MRNFKIDSRIIDHQKNERGSVFYDGRWFALPFGLWTRGDVGDVAGVVSATTASRLIGVSVGTAPIVSVAVAMDSRRVSARRHLLVERLSGMMRSSVGG